MIYPYEIPFFLKYALSIANTGRILPIQKFDCVFMTSVMLNDLET